MIEQIIKTREYLNYIEEHYNNVQKAWEIIKEKCKDMFFMADDYRYFSIQEAVETHDFSKLSPQEFLPYRKKFYPTKWEEENDNTIEREFNSAWEHHKKNNPHHFENWKEIKGYPAIEVHVVHNMIDLIAMSMKFGGTAESFYEKNKTEFDFPQWADEFVHEIFESIKQ